MTQSTTLPATADNAPTAADGSRLVSTAGQILPLQRSAVTVTAGGGLARTRLVQTFRNPYREPLAVEYLLPLPADGAIAAFAFTVGDRRIVGEVDRKQNARERFEQAVVAGHTAALLEQQRDGLFRQQVGNVPPGQSVEVEIEVDQPLLWRAPDGEWEYRFPTAVAPRYQGAAGRVDDAAGQAVAVADAPLPAGLELELTIADRCVAPPCSPSHRLTDAARNGVPVTFADGPQRLDRDVVVRWPVGEPQPQAELAVARPPLRGGDVADAFGLLTLVPPRGPQPALARDLVLLLDTSGSMHGEPLAQAVAVACALVDSLGDQDRLQMVEFSNASRRWRRRPSPATARDRSAARAWLQQLQARGGTEMLGGVRDALQPLRGESQTQVVLLTDGLIGFEREITGHLANALPAGCRFHVLGVGDAANRSLTRAAARAGRGSEAIVGLGEPPQRAAGHLVAAMAQPVVVDVEVHGSAVREVAPHAIPDLFAGAPTRIALRLDPAGGVVKVHGRTATGTFTRELHVPAIGAGDGRRELATSFARERVEDLEVTRAASVDELDGTDDEIERVGLRYAIATRRTSWIATTDEPTVDARQPTRRVTMPHELPHGMSVAGLRLRACSSAAGFAGVGETCKELDLDVIHEDCLDYTSAPPPAAPPESRARSGSLLGALGGWIGDLFGRADAATWTVRLVRRSDAEMVLEFAAAGGATWRLPRAVELRWRDGTVLTVRVDAARSTATATLAGGAIARLVVALPAARPASEPDQIGHNGEWHDLS